MTTPEKYDSIISKIAPVFLLILSILASLYYFSRPKTLNQTLAPPYYFYNEANPNWIIMSEDKLRKSVAGEIPSPWNLEVSRSLMSRWRLRPQSEAPWNNLLDQYDNGFWLSPDREVYSEIMILNDRQWIERRKSYPEKVDVLSLGVIEIEDQIISLNLNRIVETEMAGSLLKVIIQSDQNIGYADSPGLHWEVNGSGEKSFLRKLGITNQVSENEIEVVYDMSWEPLWIGPTAFLDRLEFAIPTNKNIEIISIQGTDSPLLPIE